MSKTPLTENRYKSVIEKVFFAKYRPGDTQVDFERDDLAKAASSLGKELPKNLGDIVYSTRYRSALPKRVAATQPPGKEWVIDGTGRAKYAFKLVPVNRIVPNAELAVIKIPDATPEIVTAYALSDEQALLAKVRYNRLIDIFVGVAAYSLQNHLRTTVRGIGQVEIDEIYVGVDRYGRQFVMPVQAKGGADRLSVVQARQDMACCMAKFPHLICRAISAQFMAEDTIALFELVLADGDIRILEEKHYRLVPRDQIEPTDLEGYSQRAP